MDTIDTMEIPMMHTQESWDRVGLGQEGLDSLIRAAFLRPVQIVRQSIPHNGQTLYADYAGYANIRFGLCGLGPAKTAGNQEDTLIPIEVYTNPIDNTSDMEIWGYAAIRFGNRRFGYEV
jgi:hypothetical protein